VKEISKRCRISRASLGMFKGRKNDQQKEIPWRATKNNSKGRANHSQKCATNYATQKALLRLID